MPAPLDLGALRAFYLTGTLGGVGAAARALEVTQPAVSQRLAALERSAGVKLYGRVGRRARLTEAGERLLGACREAFAVLDATEAALRGQTPQPLTGTVRIASLSEAAKAFLLPAVLAMRKAHPGVAFELTYRLPYEMLDVLMRGEADIVVTNELYQRPQLEMIARWKEDVLCVGRGPGRKLGWKELEKAAWLGYGAEDPLRYELDRAARRAGVALSRPAVHAADVESVMTLAACGAGLALVPAHALRLRRLPGLAVHRLPLRFEKTLYLGRVSSVVPGRAARAFWDSLLSDRPKAS